VLEPLLAVESSPVVPVVPVVPGTLVPVVALAPVVVVASLVPVIVASLALAVPSLLAVAVGASLVGVTTPVLLVSLLPTPVLLAPALTVVGPPSSPQAEVNSSTS